LIFNNQSKFDPLQEEAMKGGIFSIAKQVTENKDFKDFRSMKIEIRILRMIKGNRIRLTVN